MGDGAGALAAAATADARRMNARRIILWLKRFWWTMAERGDAMPPPEPPLWQAVLAGSAGGVACTLVGHPFETVKVRLQTGQTRHLFRRLYAGLLSPLAGVTPTWAITYWAWRLGVQLQPDSTEAIQRAAMAGGFCGVVQCIVKAPVEAVKVVAQNERITAVEAMRSLFRAEGVAGIYRGMLATTIHMSYSQVVFFGVYQASQDNLPIDNLFFRAFLAGGLSGLAEWSSSMPTDVVKTRIQSGETPRGRSYVSAFADVYREHGVRGYYRGFLPTICRAFPANGAALLAIEGVNLAFRRHDCDDDDR